MHYIVMAAQRVDEGPKDGGNGPGEGRGLGKGRKGSATLDFAPDWVVVNFTVGVHLRVR